MTKRIRLADLKQPQVESKKAYEEELAELQLQMLRIQSAYRAQKRRALLVFQGPDAAGKGGAIRRMVALLDPRAYSVMSVGAPTAQEQGRHYLYRFWRELPVPGHLAIFDRSWYGRVLVERIEGFCDKAAWQRAYEEINAFEKLLHDDGAVIVKVLLQTTADEQLERFKDRLHDPVKRWKLTTDDLRNRKRWDDYIEAHEDMLAKTSTAIAPWTVVGANNKRHARLAVLRAVTKRLSDGVDLSAPLAPHALIREACTALGFALPPDIAPSADRTAAHAATAALGEPAKGQGSAKGDDKKAGKPKSGKSKSGKSKSGKSKSGKSKSGKSKSGKAKSKKQRRG